MKYFTAILSGIFIFLAVFFLSGLVLVAVMPSSWTQIDIHIGLLSANIPSLISFILGGAAATYTFKASLHAKTGKLYKKEKQQK